ncbi:MAG: sporulation protein [Bacilli bacterium]|nr:sporulation protein [Bacilli bacterium]
MDKTKITYRFDPNMKPAERIDSNERSKVIPLYEEEFRIVEDITPLKEYPNDYGAWNSPFDAETRRIEQMIRESNETRMREPKRTAYPDHDRFAYEEYDDRSKVPYQETQFVRRSIPWIKIISTAAGAIITGVLLGYLIITLFSGSKSAQSQKTIETSSDQKQAALPTAGQTTLNNTTTSSIADASKAVSLNTDEAMAITIPARTYTFLQNGEFSTAQRAEKVQADLRSKGFAAVMELLDKYYIYVGIAADHDSALPLSQQMKSQKIEIYTKPYLLPAIHQIKWTGKTEAIQTYLAQADQLVQMLSGITMIHLDESELTPIEDTTVQSVTSAHAAWIGTSALVNAAASDDVKPILQKMTNAMSTAKLSIDDYKKNPSFAMLWQTQTNLMQFIIAEKSLLNEVKSS